MGYGAISGIPIVTRTTMNIATAQQSSRIVQIPPQTNRVLTERSPLIVQRRRIRRHQSDRILNWKIVSLFLLLVVGVFIGIHLLFIEYNEWPMNYPFHLIDRSFWNKGSVPIEQLNLTRLDSDQVSNVVLFHTRSDYCFSYSTCLSVIREMLKQNFSDTLHSYNFLIGGDGKTYELRGWNFKSGFDNLPFNDQAITVALIGDFTQVEPATNQVQEVEAFISESIRRKKLMKNYKIHGARLHQTDGHKMFIAFKQNKKWAGWI